MPKQTNSAELKDSFVDDIDDLQQLLIWPDIFDKD